MEAKNSQKAKKAAKGSLFAYADSKDILLMILGSLGCLADGATMPLIMLALGRITNNLAANPSSLTLHRIKEDSMILIHIAVGVGLGAFFEGLCWAWTAVRQTSHLRREYLTAILRQDVGLYDTQSATSTTYGIILSISSDTLTIQDVIAEKVPNFLMNLFMFLVSQLAALYLCWRLALVTLPTLTLLIAPGIVYGKLLAEVGKKFQEAYQAAGEISEKALSSIKTVFSYVGEEQTQRKYAKALDRCLSIGIKQGTLKGMAIGSVGVAFAVWSFQAWYGSVLVTEKGARGGDVFNAGVCIVMGGLALGSSLINIKCFVEANAAISKISEMIERAPTIDSNDIGTKITEFRGEIEFKDVDFCYPSRPETVVLRKFSLQIVSGQTVGLVGGSGSGKSTIILLIERFYVPNQGEILFDGIHIETLQLKWLRDQIGLVSQEPVLFATSIKENILFGKENASMEEIIFAAKAANAHEFISQLPDGYDSHVGQLGSQLSGGQKQRIAIARALLKKPRILLLDEATSALDSQSEKVVQDTLDQASLGQTTVIVAHRLSTLQNANLIAVMQSGRIMESGTHNQLLEVKDGHYAAMVKLQNRNLKDNEVTIPSNDQNNQPLPGAEMSREANYNLYQMCNKEEEVKSSSLKSLMKMSAPEMKEFLLGCAGAVCFGAIQPMHSYCMGELLSIYFLGDHHDIKVKTRIYCFVFLSYAILAFISTILQHYNFSLVGEKLTKRVRESLLAKILSFEAGWFDEEGNSSGSICSRLTSEVNILRSLLCDRLSLLTQVSSASILAAVIGLILSWRLAIVIIALQPVIIASFYTRGVLMRNVSHKVLKATVKSSQLASEAVTNHRTITAFCSQEKILAMFDVTLKDPQQECRNSSWVAGLGLFFSQFLTAANSGLVLWYGGYLLYHHKISYKHLFQTFFVLVTTGRVIAEAGIMTSDISKGTEAIQSMFLIMKRETKIDPDDINGLKPERIEGYIELNEVEFSYPTRTQHIVLNGLSLKIEAGKTIALVGRSGSGKSTIIGLIERFHDVSRGTVKIDGVDIRNYNLKTLRSHIALVSQEPTLFSGSIHDNICYGKEDATEAEVIRAAILANAHEFISCMKDGYGTSCGERGSQLSGGQKQRIALARAILKNPSILLLDEATSALDNNSEALVQEALEKIMKQRTSVVVAHRLSTIMKSDLIYVIEKGRVAEVGTHYELLEMGERGSYCSLVRLQENQNFEQGQR
ncbi:uncharacterized protein A4U43_C09F11560 [Asparagus officinalis]|uniref:Multidrug resistance protein n=1 Tax=Asparagus officinalis TaxID=4686 RepID=A0A5P1E6X9_ASPOF|nr:putative multidrug resistance protein [Asparagus officinalis]ONK58371.1 uncharacterized protein A4U43_C09F11560 [Asparagus officinalis]